MEELVVDLLVKNAFIITMNEQRSCVERGAIAIADHRIAMVGKEIDVLPKVRAAEVIDAKGGIVHPGFVDAHVHFMNTARGAFSDTLDTSTMMNTLRRWWDTVEEEDERAATFLNCLEMLSNGTTCFLEAGTLQFPDAAAEAAETIGIRGLIGDPFLWDLPTPSGTHVMARAPRSFDRSIELIGGQLKRNKKDALIRGCVVLFGLGSASSELMRAAKRVADDNGVIFSQHQSYDHHDTNADTSRLGQRPMCHYADHDIIGENCTFSHMNDLDEAEVSIVKQAGMSAVWCPVTSMNLGAVAARTARHLEMAKGGANVALASDGVSSGCRYDIGLQGLVALLGMRSKADSRSSMSAYDVLELATRGGARAMGMESEIGSIEPGKYADIVVRHTELPEAHPDSDPIQSLVYNCGSKSVSKVIVNGALVWEAGKPVHVDASEVYDLSRKSQVRMMGQLGLSPQYAGVAT